LKITIGSYVTFSVKSIAQLHKNEQISRLLSNIAKNKNIEINKKEKERDLLPG
jgi:ribosomal protein L32E